MAKRFTDTEKWHDPWFRKLGPEPKVFWQLLVDLCDNAGFWKIDYELASFLCNFEVTDQTLRDINRGKERVKDHGKFLEIIDFVNFQFGDVESSESNLHKSVKALREKYKIQGYMKGSRTPMVKVKDKVKVTKPAYPSDFENFWAIYPKKIGKPNALVQWKKLSDEEKAAVLADIPKRKSDVKWIGDGEKTFIKDPERYLKNRQWEDQIIRKGGEAEEPNKPRTRVKLNPDGSPLMINGVVQTELV